MPKKKAAQQAKSRINLNLLYPQGVKSQLPILFLRWLIAYGRFIVIIVELVVVATFVTRFKYDADLEDLKDQIKQGLPYLESLSADELKIRQAQLEIDTVKQHYKVSPDWSELFRTIAQKTPQSVKFTNLALEPIKDTSDVAFRISASTASNDNLIVFIRELKNTPNFKDINLATISFEEGNITFTLTGMVKKTEVAKQ